jgi:hypothetical protein
LIKGFFATQGVFCYRFDHTFSTAKCKKATLKRRFIINKRLKLKEKHLPTAVECRAFTQPRNSLKFYG